MKSGPPVSRSCRDAQRAQGSRMCKIVTFYEDFNDAIRAHQMVDRIARRVNGDLPFLATAWRFGLLGKSELNATILRDVAVADVIVVASNGDRELPERVACWIEVCMNGLPDAMPVLVALHDEGSGANRAAGPFCASLRKLATSRHAKFMCNGDFGECEAYQPPSEPVRVQRDGHASHVEIAPYPATIRRWWGINE